MTTKSDRELALFEFFGRERPTVDALHNWAAWAKDRTIRRTCYSAEGRYKSPQNDDDRQPVQAVDIKLALILAKSISPPAVPRRVVFVLSAWFIFDLRENAFCRYMRLHGFPLSVREIETEVHKAVLVARNRIARYTAPHHC